MSMNCVDESCCGSSTCKCGNECNCEADNCRCDPSGQCPCKLKDGKILFVYFSNHYDNMI